MIVLTDILYALVALVALFSSGFASFDLARYLSSQSVDPTLKDGLWEYHDDEVFWWPLLVNFLLVWLFIAQHSLMAHPTWKNLVDHFGLSPICRAVYVIFTSISLQTLIHYWLPMPAHPLWFMDTSERPFLFLFFFLFHFFMWLLIFASVLTMDCAEMIGIKQVYYHLHGWEDPMVYKSASAQKLYSHMRHPGVGPFLLLLWIHPLMSLERFFLAVSWTLYLLFGFRVSVRDYVYIERQVVRKTASMTGTLEITHSY